MAQNSVAPVFSTFRRLNYFSLLSSKKQYIGSIDSDDFDSIKVRGFFKKEILDRIKQRLDNYFLPHIGLKMEHRIEKAISLCKFLKQFFIAKESTGQLTDKDHYANKRVRMSGDLLSDLFRVNMNILLRDIQYSLQKIQKRKKFYSIKTIAKSTLFTHRMESAIATGKWIGERSGVTQNMDKTNYLAIISQLQRVSSMLPGE